MKKNFSVLIALISVVCTISINLQAQKTGTTRTVSGIVTDNSNNPLPGVSIILTGTDKGTATDRSGKYSLEVPENATLMFMYLGCTTQKIAVENQQEINVIMKERDLDEGIKPAKPIDLTARQHARAKVDNGFAFKMFQEVSKQEGENTFFSPLSLHIALGMLYNGSSGNTRKEIVETLGLTGFTESEINEYYQKISQSLLEVDPSTNIGIANSIWFRDEFSAKDRFVEIGKKYFDTEVKALDFNTPQAANSINKWCADKTNKKISQIVSSPIPKDMMMYLINALYFKSKWETSNRFDEQKTKSDDFTKTDNQKKKVNMMEQTTYLSYYADEHLQCVELDYGNRAFSTVVILPSKNMNINQLIQYLDNAKWQGAVNDMWRQKVWLKLPRFKIECDFSLNQPIRHLGMEGIFSGGFANISDDPLWVSTIKQKTFVEVNEEGAEAYALSSITVVGYGVQRKVPDEPVRFFADRPFLFLIREKSTGVILFIGRIDEPVE